MYRTGPSICKYGAVVYSDVLVNVNVSLAPMQWGSGGQDPHKNLVAGSYMSRIINENLTEIYVGPRVASVG